MKNLSIAILLFIGLQSNAQFENIFASEGDAQVFINNYTEPLFGGLLSATNSNWITSAKPIKPFKFELNIGASGALIPSSKETFKFNDSDYDYLRLESGPTDIPTVMGKESYSRLKIVIPLSNGVEYKVLDFDAPGGVAGKLPLNMVPAPNIQFSMGLPLGFEVNARYLPKIVGNNAYVQITGVGLKHSISQYFPAKKDENGKKKKRTFNLAIHANYQNISGGVASSGSDKSTDLQMNTISGRALASLDYKFLSLYSSVGYSVGYAKFNVKGTYNYSYEVQDMNGNFIRNESLTVVDPIQTDFNTDEVFFSVGAKIKLFVFQIYADYTQQTYPVANVGIGFMF